MLFVDTDEKIQKRVIEMDESFEPYTELEDALFENEKMNVKVIHLAHDDLELCYYPESYDEDVVHGLIKMFTNGYKGEIL